MQTGYDSLHRTSGVDSQCQNCSKGGKNAIYIVKSHLWKGLPHLTAHLIGQIPKQIKQTKLNTLKPLNQPGNLNTIKRHI